MSATSRPAAVSGRYAGMVIGLLLTVTLAGAGCGWQTPRNADGTAATSAVSRIDTLDPGSMKEFLAAGTPAVIEFGGKRCIPCIEMRETLEDLGRRRSHVRLGIVFWEDNPEMFEEWNVPLIPAQIIFDADGREVTRHRGSWAIDSLLAHIDNLPR